MNGWTRSEPCRRPKAHRILCNAFLWAAISSAFAQGGDAVAPDASIAASASPAPMPGNGAALRRWALRVPGVEPVVVRGTVNHDATGMGAGAMMYVAPGPVGFLAAVIAHGVVTAGMREGQKSRVQADADLVLQPLAPLLITFTHQRLFDIGWQHMSAGGTTRVLHGTESAGDDWLVESAPIFSMTQDRRALVLDNVVRIFAPHSQKVAYQQTVRVVSTPLELPADASTSVKDAPTGTGDSVSAIWLAEQGQRFTDETATIFAESVDIVLAESVVPTVDEKSSYKTYRYGEGGAEKMERAQLVSERCGRRLIRTLRGWLMSVPISGELGKHCADRLSTATPK